MAATRANSQKCALSRSRQQAQTLTFVRAASEADEAVRDLCRCREDTVQDLGRARHRLGKMLLRRGLVYRDGKSWTQGHRRWLWSLELENPATKSVFEDYRYRATRGPPAAETA